MGKTSKWLRSFLTGKKDHREKDRSETGIIPAPITPATPKEKRRWSFRRSSATAPAANSAPTDSAVEMTPPSPVVVAVVEREDEPKKQALTVAAATAAAANAAAAAAQAAAAAVRMTAVVEEAAAVKIQAFFRSYLARKALRALKGLVKLQALVRGHLVRKRATATLRCMQALVTLQAKARAQRLGMVDDTSKPPSNPRLSTHRKSTHDSRIKNIHYQENEENIKIVEMDIGEMNRNQHHHHQQFKMYSRNLNRGHEQLLDQYSPAPSAFTEMSPRAYSNHFEDYTNSFNTAQSSPQCFKYREFYCNNSNNNTADSLSLYDYPLFPNYMANTQSSRAKARSQSAPKQRPPELYERQTSGRRRASMEAPRNSVQRAMRMQRSSSQVSATATVAAKEYYQQYYPWMAIKLDRSTVSIKDSECGSTSTVMTNTNYCRSLVTCVAHGNRY